MITMNLKDYDLKSLSMLYKASSANPVLKDAINNELRLRIATNTNFTREFFFNLCYVRNKAVGINFNPASDAFKAYGENITVSVVFTEEEAAELIRNISKNPPVNTQGVLKAKVLVKGNLSEGQVDKILNEGFKTQEIIEILTT